MRTGSRFAVQRLTNGVLDMSRSAGEWCVVTPNPAGGTKNIPPIGGIFCTPNDEPPSGRFEAQVCHLRRYSSGRGIHTYAPLFISRGVKGNEPPRCVGSNPAPIVYDSAGAGTDNPTGFVIHLISRDTRFAELESISASS
jgi:hypothetical protein